MKAVEVICRVELGLTMQVRETSFTGLIHCDTPSTVLVIYLEFDDQPADTSGQIMLLSSVLIPCVMSRKPLRSWQCPQSQDMLLIEG